MKYEMNNTLWGRGEDNGSEALLILLLKIEYSEMMVRSYLSPIRSVVLPRSLEKLLISKVTVALMCCIDFSCSQS